MHLFRNVANAPTVVHFCKKFAKHVLLLLLYVLFNPNLQLFISAWQRRHVFQKPHNEKPKGIQSDQT
jgi:hypothetical protein